MNMHLAVPGESQDSFAALSAAVHPAWHQAILRLASATERVAERFDAWGAATSLDGSFLRECRDLAETLINFIDEADEFAQHELEVNEDDSRQEEADMEPALGAADRIIDQDRAWGSSRWGANQMDGEMDDSDAEESDEGEDDDPAEEAEASGCGDLDGMMEQYRGFYAHHGEVQ